MDRTKSSQAHGTVDPVQQSFETILLAQVITCGESMCSVQTNSEGNAATSLHNLFQMFKAMANTLALARGILEQNSQRLKPQSVTSELDTIDAGLNTIGLAKPALTTRMYHKLIDSE
jgi:hypothetical protein